MRFRCCCSLLILLAGLAVPGWATGVVNGTFDNSSGCVDFATGWTVNYALTGSLVTVGSSFNHTPGGSCSAVFGASGPYYDQISQQLLTIPGDNYSVYFWLYPGDQTSSANSSFREYVDGLLGVDATSSAVNDTWNLYTSTFTGTGDDQLTFQGYNGNDSYFLDDVSLTNNSVPEPGSFGLLGCALVALNAASRRLRRRA